MRRNDLKKREIVFAKGADGQMIFETKGSEEIKRLFGDWQETMVWSCLQGVMGHLYTDDP